MSFFTLGRVIGLACSAAALGSVATYFGCKKSEESKGLGLKGNKITDKYESITKNDGAPVSSTELVCKSVRLFTDKELPSNPKEQLSALIKYRDAKATYDAIPLALHRPPNEDEARPLVEAVAAINSLGAKQVFLPNSNQLDLSNDNENIYEAIRFLEFLKNLQPKGDCFPGDYKNRDNPTHHQIECQAVNDWKTDNLRIKWKVYECLKDHGETDRRLLTQLNQQLMPKEESSVTTYLRD